MSPEVEQHVFISYVREDAAEIDKLCRLLERSNIPYWRDRNALAPGDLWKAKIRAAIRNRSLVFLACFSEQSRSRGRSTMNEEMTLAVEEFRSLPPGATWLIPVRLDDGPLPEWDLGAGRMLADLQYVDLFGDDYVPQAGSLVTTIARVMGAAGPPPRTTLAAVAALDDSERVESLSRLTKEMLPDPARRIQLNDIVSAEVRRVLDDVRARESKFVTDAPRGGDARVVALVEHAEVIWRSVEPFCASLKLATRWGGTGDLSPWASGLRSLVGFANKVESGYQDLLDVRHLLGVGAISVTAMSGVTAGRWDNLKALVVDPRVTKEAINESVPLIEGTGPWAPFRNVELAGMVSARVAQTNRPIADVLMDYRNNRSTKLYTPMAEWLHAKLETFFDDVAEDKDQYARDWDRVEVSLGIISQDCATLMYADKPELDWLRRSSWFGRSVWRARHRYGNAISLVERELEEDMAAWPPLQGGLFGGDVQRAINAVSEYAVQFNRYGQTMW